MQRNRGNLSDQCKEIEENNRMGKTRDLFKKIRDTKETFHAKVGSIKDRNCMDCVDHNKLWTILKEMGILAHLTSHSGMSGSRSVITPM